MDKELRKIVKALEDQGFEVTTTKRQHIQVRKDGHLIVTMSGTPSDHRSLLNGLARLKRAGFRWPPG